MGWPWAVSQGSVSDLRRPHAITTDELDDWKLGHPQLGDTVQITDHRARIVAKTQGILGFVTAPYVFTTLDNARDYTGIQSGYCSFYLVRAKKGSDVDTLCRQIQRLIPELEVYSSRQFSQKSRVYWATRTGIGMSFGGATCLGLVVGLVMVSQSLYAFVLDHAADYATLKAMGAENGTIYRIVLVQGLLIAGTGTSVGSGVTLGIQLLASSPYVPILIPLWLMAISTGLAFLICLISVVLPFHRIQRVDPVSVLQG
jgi:putative ABC transport system permease protein